MTDDTTRKVETIEIDGVHYRCRMMPGWTAMELWWDMVNLLGEPLVVALTQAFREDMDSEIDEATGKVLANALFALTGRVDRRVGVDLMKRAFVGVLAEGVGTKDEDLVHAFDEHFRGRTWAALRLFVWSLQVNFRDFLDASGLRSLVTDAAKEAATKVSLHRTSPRSSDGSVLTQTESVPSTP